MISTITQDGSRRVIRLSGDLTFDHVRQFPALQAEIASSGGTCSLDLQAIEQADACGLGMLLLAEETAANHGIRLEILMPETARWQTARLARLERVLTLRPGPDPDPESQATAGRVLN